MEEDIVYNDVVKIERVGEKEKSDMKKAEERQKLRQSRDPLDNLADDLGDDY